MTDTAAARIARRAHTRETILTFALAGGLYGLLVMVAGGRPADGDTVESSAFLAATVLALFLVVCLGLGILETIRGRVGVLIGAVILGVGFYYLATFQKLLVNLLT